MAKCEHIFVTAGAVGPRALWIKKLFNLGTASHKVVHCTLHDYHVEGREIDVAYEEFKRSHCDSCREGQPAAHGPGSDDGDGFSQGWA